MIDKALVERLVSAQFPQWKNLKVWPVEPGGWDNQTFHLGEHMVVRLPSSAEYAAQVEKEQKWLPKLAPKLPVPIPIPLAMGKPAFGYPWNWSIYPWLEGIPASSTQIDDLEAFASDLAQFLLALQRIDPTDGPLPGPHSFYRGGPLRTYDGETRKAIDLLKGKIDASLADQVWESALMTSWKHPPVWVHGDLSAGNLLIKEGRLCAVIDFGQLAIGDPACDLAIYWTLLKGNSRKLFRSLLPLDLGTWARGRAWALWKALIIAAGITKTNSAEGRNCWVVLEEVLAQN